MGYNVNNCPMANGKTIDGKNGKKILAILSFSPDGKNQDRNNK